MENYRECNLWKKSRSLLFYICRITDQFPAEEKQRIGNQLQNYCIQNLSNIIKCCYQGRNRKGKLLENSICAMNSLEKCLQRALGLHILNENEFHYLSQEMSEIRMLITASNAKSEM